MNYFEFFIEYPYIIPLLLSPLLYFARKNILIIIIVLFLINSIDCNPYLLSILTNQQLVPPEKCNIQKNFYHNIINIFQYIIATILLRKNKIISENTSRTLYALITFRTIGIFLHKYTDNKIYKAVFIDFIKEFLILRYVFGVERSKYIEISVFILKILYEVAKEKEWFKKYYYKIYEKIKFNKYFSQ